MSIDLIDAVVSLSAILDEENALLVAPARDNALEPLVAAKLRLVGLIEREGLSANDAAWVANLPVAARTDLVVTIDALREKLARNADLLRRRMALCDDLIGAIAKEARRATGGGAMVYGARGRLACHRSATPISVNSQL